MQGSPEHPVEGAQSLPTFSSLTSSSAPRPTKPRQAKTKPVPPQPVAKKVTAEKTKFDWSYYPFALSDNEQSYLQGLLAKWQARPQSIRDKTSQEWQNTQFTFLPLLAIEDEKDREAIFDDWRDAEDWAYTTAAKYWSSMNKAAENMDMRVSLGMRAKLNVLIFLSKEEDPKRPTTALPPQHLDQLLTSLEPSDRMGTDLSYILGQRMGDTFQFQELFR